MTPLYYNDTEQPTTEQLMSWFIRTHKEINDIFASWHEALGFTFANVELLRTGIRATVSGERHDSLTDEPLFGDRVLYSLLRKDLIPHTVLFNTTENDNRHIHLNDDDANRIRILQCYNQYLPGTEIKGYESSLVNGVYSLRHTVFVPYSALFALRDKYMGGK